LGWREVYFIRTRRWLIIVICDNVPFLFQPDYPNLDPFDSKEEAENWAKLAIAAFEPDEPYAPAGKGLPGEPKQTLEQIAEAQKKYKK
jgi:hypothetical protein